VQPGGGGWGGAAAACDVGQDETLSDTHSHVQAQFMDGESSLSLASVHVCGDGGRSFAFTLISRTGVQGHTYTLHRTHMGVPRVDCGGPRAVTRTNLLLPQMLTRCWVMCGVQGTLEEEAAAEDTGLLGRFVGGFTTHPLVECMLVTIGR
jgi:hypothetical protein